MKLNTVKQVLHYLAFVNILIKILTSARYTKKDQSYARIISAKGMSPLMFQRCSFTKNVAEPAIISEPSRKECQETNSQYAEIAGNGRKIYIQYSF